MADKGFKFSNNLDVRKAGPLDTRIVVNNYADLTNSETWTRDDKQIWLYNGIVVSVLNGDNAGVYMLTGYTSENLEAYKSESNWKKLAFGGDIPDVSKLTNVYIYKGSCTYSGLPNSKTSTIRTGDVYNVTDKFTLGEKEYPAGTNVAWDGEAWDPLAGITDLSAYLTTKAASSTYATKTELKPLTDTASSYYSAFSDSISSTTNGLVPKLKILDSTTSELKKVSDALNTLNGDVKTEGSVKYTATNIANTQIEAALKWNNLK